MVSCLKSSYLSVFFVRLRGKEGGCGYCTNQFELTYCIGSVVTILSNVKSIILGESSLVLVTTMMERHGGGEQVEKRFQRQLPEPLEVAAELGRGAVPNLADTLSGQTSATWIFFWSHHHHLVGPCCNTSQCPYGAFDVCDSNRLSVPQCS